MSCESLLYIDQAPFLIYQAHQGSLALRENKKIFHLSTILIIKIGLYIMQICEFYLFSQIFPILRPLLPLGSSCTGKMSYSHYN